jgi:hypothetical protein
MSPVTRNNSTLKDAMDAFFERGIADQQFYYKVGTVSEVNTDEYTFTFNPLDDTAPVVDVKMKTIASASTDDFMIVVPKDGSIAIVMYETPVTAYCVMVKECEEWRVTDDKTFFNFIDWDLISENVDFKINTLWEILCHDVRVTTDSWVFNDGNLEGLINIVDLTAKLNDLTDKVNDLITKYNSHVHTGVTTGGSLSGVTTTTETPANAFNKADYEDTKIRH